MERMIKPALTTAKRLIKKALIDAGIVDPAARGRHGLVGAVSLADMKRKFQISFLRSHGLLPHHTLIDLGCGTLRGGIPLIDYLGAGNYCGLDVRERVLTEAKKELAEHGLEQKRPLLVQAKNADDAVRDLKVDVIWAFSVLIHMDDRVLRDTLAFASRHLKADGVFFANVRISAGKDGEWQGFPVVTRPLSFYAAEAAAHGLTCEAVGPLSDLGHVSGAKDQDEQVMLKMTPAIRG
jgi:SAM-dependent methyltransferase